MSKRPTYFNSHKPLLFNYKIHEYKEAFDMLDKNKTGTILIDDLIKIKNIFLYPISTKNIQEMIKEIDTFGEGKFDFKKFIILMQKQIEYIEEIDEESILKSLKEDFGIKFLGNKRKRTITTTQGNENNLKYDEDIKLYNEYPMMVENEESIDDINTKREEGIDDGSSFTSDINWGNNNKKRKLESDEDINIQIGGDVLFENIGGKKIFENNENSNYFGKDNNSNNDSNNNNKKNTNKNSQRKKFNEKKNSNIYINSINNNNIIIYKKYLSKDLINQIEKPKKKDNYFPLIKIENNNNLNNNLNNNIQLQKPISSFCSSEYDEFNNLNSFNSRENSFSFSSDCNSFKKALFSSYSFNSKLDKSLSLNAIKMNNEEDDDLPNFGCERLIYEKKENINKKTEIKVNKERKNIKDYKKRNKSNNKTFYERDKISVENLFNSFNEIDMKEEKNNKNERKTTKIPRLPGKININNIQILNTFQLEYKRNRKKEIIIKNCIEIPYLIIIEKSALNIKEIKSYLYKKQLTYTEKKVNDSSVIKQKDGVKDKSFNINKENILKKNSFIKNELLFWNNDKYERKTIINRYQMSKEPKKLKTCLEEIKSRTAGKENNKHRKNIYHERKIKDKNNNIDNKSNYNYKPFFQSKRFNFENVYIDEAEN